MPSIPPWLATMRQISGTKEEPGKASNPTILKWPAAIAARYPEMRSYCALYKSDDTAWCGLTVAYCMAINGIRPVFGDSDTDRFFWARAWAKFGRRLKKPILGSVMIFARQGGGHVALYEREDDNYYYVRGGNQSDSVNVARYAKSQLVASVWPFGYPLPDEKPAPLPPVQDPIPDVELSEPDVPAIRKPFWRKALEWVGGASGLGGLAGSMADWRVAVVFFSFMLIAGLLVYFLCIRKRK